MSKEEFKQLETLLAKLYEFLNAKYCIIPGYVHDGPYIGIYDDNGLISKQLTGIDLETAAKLLVRPEINLPGKTC